MTRRRLLIWSACYAMVLIAGSGALFVLRMALPPEARAAHSELLGSGAALLVLAAAAAFAVTGILSDWIARTYFAPLQRQAELVKLIAGGNPAYRLDDAAGAPAEVRALALAINQLAERNQQSLHAVEQRIRDTHAGLDRERSQLAALLSDLAQSVLVCSADGRVLLYNEQARRLLCGPRAQGFLGLGRSLYALLDEHTLAGAYAGLCARLAQGELRPVSAFNIPLPQDEILQARMAPVYSETDDGTSRCKPDGYVLLLAESGTGAAPRETETDAAAIPAGRPVYYDFDLFHQPGQTREIDHRPLRELTYTVFDTETTGLDPGAGDEIISIGAIRIVNGRLVPNESYQQLVDPRRRMRADSIRVHGITPDMLAGKPLIDTVLPTFHRFCEGTVLVGHNVAFDMRFLELKASSSGVRFSAPVLDTLLLSAALHGDSLEHPLEAIAARLGLAIVDRHTALGDAITTARVFLKLLDLLAARGITTLREAREASARTAYAGLRY